MAGDLDFVNKILSEASNDITTYNRLIHLLVKHNNRIFQSLCARGQISVINLLLAKNPDASYKFPEIIAGISSKNNAALKYACEASRIEVVERLLAKDADGSYEFPSVIANIAARDGKPFINACRNKDASVVKRLLNKNPDGSYEFQELVEKIHIDGLKPFMEAFRRGFKDVIDILLARTPTGDYEFKSVYESINDNAKDILTEACIFSKNAVIDKIFDKDEHGVYEFPGVISAVADGSNEILNIAARFGRMSIVNRLLGKNQDGNYEFPQIIENLARDNNDLFIKACQHGKIDVVNRLLVKDDNYNYEFPEIIEKISVDNNKALMSALKRKYYDGSYLAVTYRLLKKLYGGNYEFPNIIKSLLTTDALREIDKLIFKGKIQYNIRKKILKILADNYEEVLINASKKFCAMIPLYLIQNDYSGKFVYPNVIAGLAKKNNYIFIESSKHSFFIPIELLSKNYKGEYNFPKVVKKISAQGNQAFVNACEHGHYVLVKKLLNKNEDGSYEFPSVKKFVDKKGIRVFSKACENGHAEVIKILLTKAIYGGYEHHRIVNMIDPSIRLKLSKDNTDKYQELIDEITAIQQDNVTKYQLYTLSQTFLEGNVEKIMVLLSVKPDGSYKYPKIIKELEKDDFKLCEEAIENKFSKEIIYSLLKVKSVYCYLNNVDKYKSIVTAFELEFLKDLKYTYEGIIPNHLEELAAIIIKKRLLTGRWNKKCDELLTPKNEIVYGTVFSSILSNQALILKYLTDEIFLESSSLVKLICINDGSYNNSLRKIFAEQDHQVFVRILRTVIINVPEQFFNLFLSKDEYRPKLDKLLIKCTKNNINMIVEALRINEYDKISNYMLEYIPIFLYVEKYKNLHSELKIMLLKFIPYFLEKVLLEYGTYQSMPEDFNLTFIEDKMLIILKIVQIGIEENQWCNYFEQLFQIPQIRKSLEINNNALFKLAVAYNNDFAIVSLLAVNSIRKLAEENNFYFKPLASSLGLSHLVGNNESSMRSVSHVTKAKLKKLKSRYKKMFIAKGKELLIIGSLRQHIIDQYNKNPLKLKIHKVIVDLPLKYIDFNKFIKKYNLNKDGIKEALKLYYKSYLHTAYRYLTLPNLWLKDNTAYQPSFNAPGGCKIYQYTNFYHYRKLIAYLWLAASDVNEPELDGYTTVTRQENFIRALALMNRAHNFNKFVINKSTGNEDCLDDLKADRPTCNRGNYSRLCQSLLGHSIMHTPSDIPDPAKIDELLFGFIRKRFESKFNKLSPKKLLEFKQSVDDYMIMLKTSDSLIDLNIKPECIAYFGFVITKVFKGKLINDKIMISSYVNEKLDPTNYDNSHFMKFFSITGVRTQDILKKSLDNLESIPACAAKPKV